jgi:hypothetical protein
MIVRNMQPANIYINKSDRVARQEKAQMPINFRPLSSEDYLAYQALLGDFENFQPHTVRTRAIAKRMHILKAIAERRLSSCSNISTEVKVKPSRHIELLFPAPAGCSTSKHAEWWRQIIEHLDRRLVKIIFVNFCSEQAVIHHVHHLRLHSIPPHVIICATQRTFCGQLHSCHRNGGFASKFE